MMLADATRAIIIEAVRRTPELPALLRDHVDEVTACEEHQFDESYIEFLDSQIAIGPRGPEWTERLMRRRAALLPYCDAPLLRGRVRVGDVDFTVEVDPVSGAVIHWEEYSYGPPTFPAQPLPPPSLP